MNIPNAHTEDQQAGQPDIGLFAELLYAVKPALLAADLEWQEVEVKQAPYFNALSLVSPDENCLSDIIAEFLDPQGSHGQGEAFLTLFLSRCGPIGNQTKNHVSIHRESRTIFIANQKRRMDILVDGGQWGIGIENKPWAGEQKDQLLDYANDLERRFGENFLLIRVTGRDMDATSMDAARQEQLSAQGKFASWRYDTDLRPWVEDCIKHCQAQRVTNLLDEFARYITAEFVTATDPRANMEKKHLLPAIESVLEKDPCQLHSLAAIAEVFLEVRQKFITQLFDEVQKDVLARLGAGWNVAQRGENFLDADYGKLAFAHGGWGNVYSVCLESQRENQLVVLGIHHHERGIKRNDQVARELKRLGWGKKAGGEYWDGHSPLPEPFRNWWTPRGIAAVVDQRAELKELLTTEFVKLCKYFKNPLAKLADAATKKK